MTNGNLKLAIQKKGRLSEKSINLLKSCGLEIDNYGDRLLLSVRNFSIDILFLRDDDIPEYVQDGVADIGIVGEDILFEKESKVNVVKKLGFGRCKLLIAIPEGEEVTSVMDLNNKRIATSHPKILNNFLEKNKLNSRVVEISGSVEITPSLGVADYICDIVSTGNTLKLHKLKKSFNVFDSEAVLIANESLNNNDEKQKILNDLSQRIDSVLAAINSKYLMMNIPQNSLNKVITLIPSLKSPTVLPLADENLLAVHAVIPSDSFWDLITDLKKIGATGILLLPIENLVP